MIEILEIYKCGNNNLMETCVWCIVIFVKKCKELSNFHSVTCRIIYTCKFTLTLKVFLTLFVMCGCYNKSSMTFTTSDCNVLDNEKFLSGTD